MMMRKGNAISEGAEHRGWFIGHFIEPEGEDDPRQDPHVEVKWGVHSPDEPKGNWTSDTATTMSILLGGKFSISFAEAKAAGPLGNESGAREVDPSTVTKRVLEEKGDFAIWGPGVVHTWAALERSTVLTVRWPSERDQEPTTFEPPASDGASRAG